MKKYYNGYGYFLECSEDYTEYLSQFMKDEETNKEIKDNIIKDNEYLGLFTKEEIKDKIERNNAYENMILIADMERNLIFAPWYDFSEEEPKSIKCEIKIYNKETFDRFITELDKYWNS